MHGYWTRALERVELHTKQHTDEYGGPKPIDVHDLASCGTCDRVWCETCNPTPAARCPFEYEHDEDDK